MRGADAIELLDRADLAKRIDSGLYAPVLSSLRSFRDSCFECKHMDASYLDEYRCKVRGYCPAVTLCPELNKHIISKVHEAIG